MPAMEASNADHARTIEEIAICSGLGTMTMPANRTEAFALVQRALRIQLGTDGGELADAESCLLKALDLDPDGIEALQEAAHFFDAVTPDPARAKEYALRCRAQAIKVTAEMDEILLQESS